MLAQMGGPSVGHCAPPLPVPLAFMSHYVCFSPRSRGRAYLCLLLTPAQNLMWGQDGDCLPGSLLVPSGYEGDVTAPPTPFFFPCQQEESGLRCGQKCPLCCPLLFLWVFKRRRNSFHFS